jgi:hypothetical protein
MAMLQSAADSRKERAMTDIVTHTDRIATIGMDLGKRSFHFIGMDARGKVIMRQQLSRGRLERHLANLQPCLVGIEACAGAHHIGRRLSAVGHNVRLIPGQYVKPFRKGQKNDYRDAEAIAEECSGRPCDLGRSRARSSSIFKRCIGLARRPPHRGHQPASQLSSRVWGYRAARTCKVTRDTAIGVGATHRCALAAHDSPYRRIG